MSNTGGTRGISVAGNYVAGGVSNRWGIENYWCGAGGDVGLCCGQKVGPDGRSREGRLLLLFFSLLATIVV